MALVVSTLAECIEPGRIETTLHFLDEREEVSYSSLWRRSRCIAAWAQQVDRRCAVLLTNSNACVAFLLGAIQSGMKIVSLPLPSRGANTEWYLSLILAICKEAQVDTVVVDASLKAELPVLDSIRFIGYDETLSTIGTGSLEPDEFVLVQFTSGSTSDPKGVLLPGSQIAANIEAILDRVRPEKGDVACSWLPLSHDMGLIGMLLSGLAGTSDRWAKGGHIVLLRPESFLRNPRSWLEACSEFRATITASPNFALDLAVRRALPSSLDLRWLRTCIVGGEPVRQMTLEKFALALEPLRFNEVAICPAYGLAEAALAVTMSSPRVRWSEGTSNASPFEADESINIENPISSVSVGKPLKGYEVRIDGLPGAVGRISVRGPSVSKQYMDGSAITDKDTQWYETSDVGFVRDGELHVGGRIDDVFLVRGRKLFATDIEAAVAPVAGVRSGRSVALMMPGNRLALISEVKSEDVDLQTLAAAMRIAVVKQCGVSLGMVGFVDAGCLPMTSSGKFRRDHTVKELVAGTLQMREAYRRSSSM